MKRKALEILIMILLFPVALNAADVVISTYTGAYGVNMASEKYSGASKNRTENYGWGRYDKEGASYAPPFENFSYGDGLKHYLDEMIVASGGVQFDETPNTGYRYVIQATCPHGVYFRSQSNPNFIRPFKLLVITRFHDKSGGPDFTGEVIVVKDTGESKTVYYHENAKDKAMWFDIVLALPLDPDEMPIDGTNYIVSDDGQRYSLVQADDYTALVTVSIRAYKDDGSLVGSDSVTIPFSGYYDGITDGKHEDRMSLMFTANGNAANLNIKMHAGTRMQVGPINFLMDSTGSTIGKPDGYVKIFFSSDVDAQNANASEFRFVHESVQSNTILTNYNSIGFDVIVDGNENTGRQSRTFDGTDHLDPNKEIEYAIIPFNGRKNLPWTSSPDRYFYEYSGDVYVLIDSDYLNQSDDSMMLEGTYTSRVYMHVVTRE